MGKGWRESCGTVKSAGVAAPEDNTYIVCQLVVSIVSKVDEGGNGARLPAVACLIFARRSLVRNLLPTTQTRWQRSTSHPVRP